MAPIERRHAKAREREQKRMVEGKVSDENFMQIRFSFRQRILTTTKKNIFSNGRLKSFELNVSEAQCTC